MILSNYIHIEIHIKRLSSEIGNLCIESNQQIYEKFFKTKRRNLNMSQFFDIFDLILNNNIKQLNISRHFDKNLINQLLCFDSNDPPRNWPSSLRSKLP